MLKEDMINIMKKICMIVLTCVFCLSILMTGCGPAQEAGNEDSQGSVASEAPAPSETPAASEELAASSSEAPSETPAASQSSAALPGDIQPVDTTIEAPAQLGQWVETMRYSPVDSEYHTVYYRITNVVRGEEAQAAVDAYNAEDHVVQFSTLENDDIEYCMLQYEVYYPEDFPQEDYGITTVDLNFSVSSPDGGGIKANGMAYIGLSSVHDISAMPEINEFYAGQTFTEGKAIYAMVKGVSDYVFEVGYFDDNDQEHVSYVQGV